VAATGSSCNSSNDFSSSFINVKCNFFTYFVRRSLNNGNPATSQQNKTNSVEKEKNYAKTYNKLRRHQRTKGQSHEITLMKHYIRLSHTHTTTVHTKQHQLIYTYII